jgi:predicted phosphodiesterase
LRIGIIADVHANEEALDAVLGALKKAEVHRIICLGDLVGYGPNPNECVAKIFDCTEVVVAGNHDYGAVGLLSIERFNAFARQAMLWTQENLSAESGRIIKSLDLIYDDGYIMAVHASPEAPDQWHYVSSEDAVFRSLMALTSPFCFIGHTHIPALFSRKANGDMILQRGQSLTLQSDQLHLINVGSVGQPRDSDPRASYGIFDLEDAHFELYRVPYDITRVQGKMKKAGISDFLIQRLTVGQ